MAPAIVEPEPIEAPDKEAEIKRNPHEDFASVEAGRPSYDSTLKWEMSKMPKPDWKVGDGATTEDCKNRKFLAIDPQEDGRSVVLNYKLMISCTVPRPIALVSTVTEDGSTRNLAPFSYFQCVTTDPPTYSLTCTGRQPNDTLSNILATKECCISMTSDWLVEAANFSSVNTPRHISEWELTGLTPVPGDVVKAPYIAESPFSIECKLLHHQDFFSVNDSSVRTATLMILQVVRFHIWEDVLNEDRATADMAKLRPVFRAGGITYGTCFNGFEIPRPEAFRNVRQDPEVEAIVQKAQAAKGSQPES
ncbi:putative Flavin reductase like domain-containing protein [Seiridium unicorne]|uniref:Flavin reductase like domain-containing protein n=1 Tax=Seiridium unicorne TaxID=138068 RepID=A0ABR2V459_9PEZI